MTAAASRVRAFWCEMLQLGLAVRLTAYLII
jgi:hypothetical protein